MYLRIKLVSFNRSLSQTKDKFENFIKNLEVNLEHIVNKIPFLVVVLGDFNAITQGWYQNDITTFEGSKINMVTSGFSLSQATKEPKHILSNSTSSIGLIFSSQFNIVMHSGVHPSLHPNCYHQTVFSKFNLTIFYPPLEKRLVWQDQLANTDVIKGAIELSDWEKFFSNLDVNKQVSVFNETIMNTFENSHL